MELRQLRYLISIIDFGSFSKASGQLHVAQPALSQQIANLEAELEKPLLVRSQRGVVPTEAGLRLYKQAQTILSQVEQAKSEILTSDFADQFIGQVSVGFPTSTSAMVALPYLRRMRDQFPGIQLRIVESLSGHLNEMLLNNRLDMAIQFRGGSVAGLQVERLLEEDLFLAMSDQRQRGEPISLSEVAGMPLMIPSKQHAMRAVIDQYCIDHKIELNIVADVDSLPALRGAASTGLAVVILPLSALAGTSNLQDLNLRPIEPKITRSVALCRAEGAPRSRASQAAEEVLRFLVRDLVESEAWTGVRLDASLAERTHDRSLVARRRALRR